MCSSFPGKVALPDTLLIFLLYSFNHAYSVTSAVFKEPAKPVSSQWLFKSFNLVKREREGERNDK